MMYQIKRISPKQTAKISAAIYALFSFIFLPFMIFSALFGPKDKAPHILVMVLFPLFYVAMGYASGFFCAFAYNLCAKWVGGVELELESK